MNIRNYWRYRKALKDAQINALFDDDMGDRYD
jgi:hypothetical protein